MFAYNVCVSNANKITIRIIASVHIEPELFFMVSVALWCRVATRSFLSRIDFANVIVGMSVASETHVKVELRVCEHI